MDAKLKADWVKALRSGEFEQCRHELTNGMGGFCCIGVGYRVLGFGPQEMGNEISTEDDGPTYVAAAALGLPSDIRDRLIELNDDERKPFPEIADYIEANL